MALKGDRAVYIDDISYVSEKAEEAGSLLCVKATQPTGRGVGAGQNEAAPVATHRRPPSRPGRSWPACSSTTWSSIDQTRQHRNFQRVEQVVGENVTLLKDGFVRTNKISGTPAAGAPAYLATNGNFSPTQTNAIPAGREVRDGQGHRRVRPGHRQDSVTRDPTRVDLTHQESTKQEPCPALANPGPMMTALLPARRQRTTWPSRGTACTSSPRPWTTPLRQGVLKGDIVTDIYERRATFAAGTWRPSTRSTS
jgi:hypothetical protein